MQTIYLDISNKGVIPTIYAKQGDVGRRFLAVLTDAGVPYSPPAGSAFSVWYDGDSGDGNYTDIGGASAFSVNANTVSVEIITQMLEKDGEGVLCLVLSHADGKQIGSWNIPYICEFVPGYESEEAKSYFTAFSDAVKNLPYPDTSLSVPGKAADSGAVGTALAGKAPAGFGLGTDVKLLDDTSVDTITETGFYLGGTGLPYPLGNSLILHINYQIWSQQLVFTLNDTSGYGNLCVRREKNSGVWDEWEWENPPLLTGVEYRTTERCGGLPVYAQRLNVGSFPETSGSKIDINTGIEVGSIVRLSANIGQWSMPYLNRQIVGTGYYTDPKDGKIKITIMLYTNISRDLGGSVDVTLYYTK